MPDARPGTTLAPGDEGDAVLALQHRLQELGYWLGTPDGSYGGLIEQAVTAFQKVEGLTPDGVAGVATVEVLAHAGRAQSRSDTGDLVEVDKDRQVVRVVRDGRVDWVLNTSTGTEKTYQVGGITGIAVHGSSSVPAYPASHGCVQVTNAAMDWIWATDVMPVGSTVWVY